MRNKDVNRKSKVCIQIMDPKIRGLLGAFVAAMISVAKLKRLSPFSYFSKERASKKEWAEIMRILNELKQGILKGEKPRRPIKHSFFKRQVVISLENNKSFAPDDSYRKLLLHWEVRTPEGVSASAMIIDEWLSRPNWSPQGALVPPNYLELLSIMFELHLTELLQQRRN